MPLNLSLVENQSPTLHFDSQINQYFFNITQYTNTRNRAGEFADNNTAENYEERFSRNIIIIRENENGIYDYLGSINSDDSRAAGAKTNVSANFSPSPSQDYNSYINGPVNFTNLA